VKKILVVDDEPALVALYCEVLRGAGFAVSSASDGLEALEKIRQEKFDLVLLDVWMPRMNGLEFLAQLRSLGSPARVVVTTADSAPETLLKAIQEQAYCYLVKPIEPKALLSALRDVLEAPAPAPIEVVSARPNWVELLVPCQRAVAERIQEFMARLEADLPGPVRDHVGQAFSELLLNAIEWGGHLDPNRKVRIAYLRAQRMLLFRICDPGPGFRFDEPDYAASSETADQLLEQARIRIEKGKRPGGFGILLARSMADELIYNEARNEVVLIKYLDTA